LEGDELVFGWRKSSFVGFIIIFWEKGGKGHVREYPKKETKTTNKNPKKRNRPQSQSAGKEHQKGNGDWQKDL
jgi:hypothetical protein